MNNNRTAIAFYRDDDDEIFVIGTMEWTYKDRKSKDKLFGSPYGLIQPLETYLEKYWMIVLMDGITSNIIDGPILLSSNKNGKKWKYKSKKKSMIKYITKKKKFIYILWDDSPMLKEILLVPLSWSPNNPRGTGDRKSAPIVIPMIPESPIETTNGN